MKRKRKIEGDYLPVMRQEAADLKELAQAADRPGMGQQMQQIAEGYEAACQVIEDLRGNLAHLQRKVAHGCSNHWCPDCDTARIVEGYTAADPMDV